MSLDNFAKDDFLKGLKNKLEEVVDEAAADFIKHKIDYHINRYSEHGKYIVLHLVQKNRITKEEKKNYIIYKGKRIQQLKKKRVFHLDLSKDKNVIAVFSGDKRSWHAAIQAANYLHNNTSSTKSKSIYTNGVMLAPDGEMLCRCGRDKIDWYLNRDLATLEKEDPPTIRLNFEPSGRGNKNDDFYLQEKENICVVCGTNKNLSKHHVVPYCFRKFFPEKLKRHSYHDVLLVCRDHHDEYEKEATKLKEQIAKEFNITMQGYGITIDEELRKVHDAGLALLQHDKDMSRRKKNNLKKILRKYFKKKQIYKKDIINATKIVYNIKENNYKEYGKYIVDNLESIQDFVIRWRKHFIKYAKPEFMPDYWDINRNIIKEL